MPRRKKKAWKKFSNKVKWVINNNLGTKDVVFNKGVTITSAANQQGVGAALLYGKAGESGEDGCVGVRDLKFLSEYMNATTATSGDRQGNLFHTTSAIMDITLTNTSETSTCNLEVDIYEVYFRNEVNNDYLFREAGILTSAGIFQKGLDDTAAPFGTSPLNIRTRGCTPFNWLNGIRDTGMTIITKKKYFIAYNNSITYQFRDPKDRSFTAAQINDYGFANPGMIYPKATRGIIIISKPVAGRADLVGTLSMGVTRNYKLKLHEQRGMEDGYVAG